MNVPVFTFAPILLTLATVTPPTDLVGAAAQYGPLGLMTLGLGWFAVWQEKQRRKRDESDKAERAEHLAKLMEVIEQKDRVIAQKDEWILGQAEKNSN